MASNAVDWDLALRVAEEHVHTVRWDARPKPLELGDAFRADVNAGPTCVLTIHSGNQASLDPEEAVALGKWLLATFGDEP